LEPDSFDRINRIVQDETTLTFQGTPRLAIHKSLDIMGLGLTSRRQWTDADDPIGQRMAFQRRKHP
jgi:hypothetical protein